MKVKEIFGALEEFAPLALQDGYDNAGLQIGLAEDAEATGALLCLDVTEEVVEEAVSKGCNLIVSHHPLLFRALKSIAADDYVGRTVMKAIRSGVAVYAAHTNLDSAMDGVNWKIAEKLGLKNLEWLSPKGEYKRNGEALTAGEGLVGMLPQAMNKKVFFEYVKETFGLKSLRVNDAEKEKVERVALCGGAGAFLIHKAVAKGADAFLTGEIGYHRFFGMESDIILMEMGHYESEQYTVEVLRDILSNAAPSLPIYNTEQKINPINYI
ncbi:MAG: Nif3-like dinuclear metal center hexameric protein [Prevotellaceae bacterium]|nr:Nif3-like dinuclear metal center hexameric protein [Prevotellaceae bacterium]